MTTQQTLFANDEPTAVPPTLPHNGTLSSKLAARSMRCSAGAQQQRVLEALQAAGDAGLTDEELQASLNLSGNSERPRRAKLVELGLVRNTGLMRRTKSGHAAVVWAAVPSDKRPAATSNSNKSTEQAIDFAI